VVESFVDNDIVMAGHVVLSEEHTHRSGSRLAVISSTFYSPPSSLNSVREVSDDLKGGSSVFIY
jgi:hypothetical protein